MGRCGIYAIRNTVNGKMYIGQQVNIDRRWVDHRWRLRHRTHYNFHLQKSYNMYGENSFEYIIIEECPKNKLDEREIYYIDKFDSMRNGYNRDKGGSWGYESHEFIEGHRGGNSEKRRILQIDSLINIVNIWESAKDAGKKLGISSDGILRCCHKSKRMYHGYFWLFEDDDSITPDFFVKRRTASKLYQFDLNMNLIKTWNSAREASQSGYDLTSIRAACCGMQKTYHGYVWRLANSYSEEDYRRDTETDFSYYPGDKRPVEVFDLDGEFIAKFESVNEAEKEMAPKQRRNISKALKGIFLTFHNYIWVYEDEEYLVPEKIEKYHQNKRTRNMVVQRRDENGNVIAEYDTLSAAARAAGVSNPAMKRACQGKSTILSNTEWRIVNTGEYKNNKHRPVRMYDQDGNFIEEFESQLEAERVTGANSRSICSVLKGRRKTAGGYVWRYADEEVKANG